MAKIKGFKGIRPLPGKVKVIASPPYDVINSSEARIEAAGNDLSFLHIIKPEIDFSEGEDPYQEKIYLKAKDNLQNLIHQGIFIQDQKECLYIYQLQWGSHVQTGLMACASVNDYFNEVIKKHELTRPDKEEDRKNHIRYTKANAEPVFFAYPAQNELDQILFDYTKNDPVYYFKADDGILHKLWVIDNDNLIAKIIEIFSKIPQTYVADGHHRTAAAALVGKELRDSDVDPDPGKEYNYFLAVHFPHDQLKIIDYNRVIKDLNGLTVPEFISKLEENFEVEDKGQTPYKPAENHYFGMYLDGKWYQLKARKNTYDPDDPIGKLDVTILYEKVFKPVLNIHDLRKDQRIDFVGGIRGIEELKKRVDSGEMKIAFALHPVSMEHLMEIADSGAIMPPKTTWFEPKLRSGLVVHDLK